jgi:hypothetical protein
VGRVFLTFILSIGAFYAFKALLPSRLFVEITAASDNIAVDSVMIRAMAEMQATLPDTIGSKEKDDAHPAHSLGRFFEKLFALEKTKKGVVRVAFFGDSMIESDMVVHDVRKNYQDKYGGYGRGFVMLSNVHKPWGLSRYDFSPQWITYTFLEGTPAMPVGVSGYVSIPKTKSVWTHFRHRTSAPALARSELFYGRTDNSNATVTVIADRDTSVIVDLQTDNILNKQPITTSSSKDLMLRFNNAHNIPFYGINFADGDGVYIDNFPMRSTTGAPLSTFNVELMNAFQQEFQYDLVMVQFGLNVLNPKMREYGWYAELMTNVLSHLKLCFPGADILVISSSDRAKRYQGVMQTDYALPALLQAQEQYAENSGAGFVNLFQLMGGAGSMVKWVRAEMAQPDYAHFNNKGAKRAADLIFKQIEDEYEEYKKENNLLVEDRE